MPLPREQSFAAPQVILSPAAGSSLSTKRKNTELDERPPQAIRTDAANISASGGTHKRARQDEAYVTYTDSTVTEELSRSLAILDSLIAEFGRTESEAKVQQKGEVETTDLADQVPLSVAADDHVTAPTPHKLLVEATEKNSEQDRHRPKDVSVQLYSLRATLAKGKQPERAEAKYHPFSSNTGKTAAMDFVLKMAKEMQFLSEAQKHAEKGFRAALDLLRATDTIASGGSDAMPTTGPSRGVEHVRAGRCECTICTRALFEQLVRDHGDDYDSEFEYDEYDDPENMFPYYGYEGMPPPRPRTPSNNAAHSKSSAPVATTTGAANVP